MPVERQDRDVAIDARTGRVLHDRAVKRDVTTEAVEYGLHEQLRALLADLRTIRDGTGNMTTAQLTNALRRVAAGEVQVIRLLVRALDDTV